MRLHSLDHGHPFGMRLLFKVIRLVSGFPAPDVVKTLQVPARVLRHAHERSVPGGDAWTRRRGPSATAS
jgi:hypothetical protein